MKIDSLKKLIKEAVREAVQEEMKEILLEAIRSPKVTLEGKTPVGVGGYGTVNESTTAPAVNVRERYSELLNGMLETRNGNLNMTSGDALGFGASAGYQPPRSVNTAGEGSALPAGEVSLDQVLGFISKK